MEISQIIIRIVGWMCFWVCVIYGRSDTYKIKPFSKDWLIIFILSIIMLFCLTIKI